MATNLGEGKPWIPTSILLVRCVELGKYMHGTSSKKELQRTSSYYTCMEYKSRQKILERICELCSSHVDLDFIGFFLLFLFLYFKSSDISSEIRIFFLFYLLSVFFFLLSNENALSCQILLARNAAPTSTNFNSSRRETSLLVAFIKMITDTWKSSRFLTSNSLRDMNRHSDSKRHYRATSRQLIS